MSEAQEKQDLVTEIVKDETQEAKPVSKKRKKQKITKKKSRKRTKKKEPTYNVDKHPDTGVMLLPELHYLRLMVAEQNVKIMERDLQIARSNVKDFQTQANTQLQILQKRASEAKDGLTRSRITYINEVKVVEDATNLQLKDWLIDDDRVLRPIEDDSKK